MTTKLSLEPSGREFVLSRTDASGNRREMVLSDDDVLTLAQSAERLRDHILSQRTPTEAAHPAVSAVPVAQFELNCDVHETVLHLAAITPNGARSHWFEVPPAVARALLDSLPRWLARIEKKKPAKH